MQRLVLLALVLLVAAPAAAEIDRDTQIEIIENYLWVTGQLDEMPDQMSAAITLDGHDHPHAVKCGMSHVLNFKLAYNQLDKDLLRQYSAALPDRPTRANTYDSPAGYFKIHYNTTGSHAVYNAEETLQGVPVYVVKTAEIFDSVYYYFRDTLGYRMPQSDAFYNGGGDGKYDIYLSNVGALGVYGLTYLDSAYVNDGTRAKGTSFIEIDNDFQGTAFPTYRDRPLDAVRVTAAHEFFHAIHFEYDFFEAELPTDAFGQRRYWMEMSAVWAEEEQYDHINDYYLLLPFFFDDPHLSLQQFNSLADPRPYAAGIFPMFIADYYGNRGDLADSLDGRDLIRKIWQACDTLGAGPSFLIAFNNVIREQTTELTQPWVTGMREFALWNFFTGDRADLVPVGVRGYEERAEYPQFPEEQIGIFDEFDFLLIRDTSQFDPEHLAATYFKLDQVQAVIGDDTTYWVSEADWLSVTGDSIYVDTTCWRCRTIGCNSYIEVDDWMDLSECDSLSFDTTVCRDSCQIRDPNTAPFTTIWSDTTSILKFGIGLDPEFNYPWGLSIVYQYANDLDSLEVDRIILPPGVRTGLLEFGVPYTGLYRSVTLMLTPASPFRNNYSYSSVVTTEFGVNLEVREAVDSTQYDFNIDPDAVNLAPTVLSAYPNPAVVGEMMNPQVTFRFQLPTDAVSAPLYDQPLISMDIYTVAGERVMSMDSVVTATPRNLYLPEDQEVVAEISWNMLNESGTQIASGVYVGVAQLFQSADRVNLLADETVKVLIVR